MSESKLGKRVQDRLGQLKYFKKNDKTVDESRSNEQKIMADEHLLWGYLKTQSKEFRCFSPLPEEYLAFFDVYLEFFFKQNDFPRVKEVESYLRDLNHSVSYSEDFNWELAEKLMNNLGLGLKSHLDRNGGLICHCYGHHLSSLMQSIKEFKFDTLAKLQASLPIGDKCKKCLSQSGLPQRPLALSQVFSLSQRTPEQIKEDHWKSWNFYFADGAEGFSGFSSKNWQHQLQCLSECLESSFSLFFKSCLEVLNYHFDDTQGQVDVFLLEFTDDSLSSVKAFQNLLESHLSRVLKSTFKLRLFREKSGQAILLD